MRRDDRLQMAAASAIRAYRQTVAGKSKMTADEIAEMWSSEFMLNPGEREKLSRLLPRRGGKK